MPDFLLELRSEEIPARMQEKARADLGRLFAAELAASGLAARAITTFATPRRLALIAQDLPDRTAAVAEEIKGPRASAPPQALEGFLRKTGLTADRLIARDGVLFALIEKPGRATADVLAAAIPAIIRAFPWPKAMRWGSASLSTESPRWVRPLQGVIAILGEDVLACEAAGIVSGATTVGHRFHHPGPITIGGAVDYVEKLRACHVIVDGAERRAIIASGAAGLDLVEDEGLLIENAGLTEFPVPLLGRFDPAFLAVPPEVIQLSARVNQKYFVCRDRAGTLANAFVCVANIDAADGGARIVEGNQKVLAARLSDARFFYQTDLQTPLADRARKLDKIVFQEKLGSVADRVDRVARLARWLVEQKFVGAAKDGALAAMAEQAARLCKADLVTGMVGEFPELQGIMGGYYARAEGLPEAVADAIRDHYKPIGQGDDVPSAPVTVAVGLADKLDTLVAFFAHDMAPTGSKDPYALRRAALGAIATIVDNRLRLPLMAAFGAARQATGGRGDRLADGQDLLAFFADRLKVQQREAGVRHDLIDAVFALGGEDDLVRLLARVAALQAFVASDDGANLLAGYKRAANILKKEGYEAPAGSAVGGETGARADLAREEADLRAALETAEAAADRAIADERFAAAMTALAGLRAPIDAFFEHVTVNDPDPARRRERLALLARVRDACGRVADFSRIEG